jgi:hypothetical protein
MYGIRFEGASAAEKRAIEKWVPTVLNNTVTTAMGIGESLISRWFGDAAIKGGAAYA